MASANAPAKSCSLTPQDDRSEVRPSTGRSSEGGVVIIPRLGQKPTSPLWLVGRLPFVGLLPQLCLDVRLLWRSAAANRMPLDADLAALDRPAPHST